MNGTTLNFDRVTRTAPLGMRFADAVTASPVGGGLKVELFSLVNPYQRCFAAPNRSGVYVVHDLPGSSDSGRGAGDDDFWTGPLERQDYRVEISDPAGRFQPFSLRARVPVQGLFMPDCMQASPPDELVRHIPLFSAPTRPVPGVVGVIRAEIRTWAEHQPASWLLLAISYRGQILGRGIADRDGRIAVIFPYPEPPPRRRTSPLESTGQPSWDMEIDAYHSPDLFDLESADLCEVLHQPRAQLLDDGSPVLEIDTVTLTMGRELVLRSESSSFVLVRPA